MNAAILNREFQHPADGWYQIEPMGRHPNRAAGVVQVIDEEAAASIVNRFNADAAAGNLRHGAEMLIDHEHFSDQADKETIAYGWLQRLQNRGDGIYGQIRWSATGQRAVDGGDYRFFSTEYEPSDCAVLNRDGRDGRKGTEVRPLRLAGLSLTNMNNNRGGKPITNRQSQMADGKWAGKGVGTEFRRGLVASAVSQQQQTKEIRRMKTVATRLGLAADASEEAVLAQVSTIMNRATELEGQVAPLNARVTALEAENTTLLGEQLDADLAAAGITDAKIINRHKPLLSDPKHFKNRAERIAFIADLAPKGTAVAQKKLLNRETKPPTDGKAVEGGGQADAARATKIMNRAAELVAQKRAPSLATAVAMAQAEES